MKNYDGWLEISDIHKFTKYLRSVVYINYKENETEDSEQPMNFIDSLPPITPEEQEELASILNQNESLLIVKDTSKKIRHKKTKRIKYLVNDHILSQILENLNQRMISNIITGLVSKGYLESAFDSEQNEFVFWAKDISNTGLS